MTVVMMRLPPRERRFCSPDLHWNRVSQMRMGVEQRVALKAETGASNTAMKWLYAVERLALRAVAPRRAARKLPPPGAGSDSGRPLCAGGVVAARPLPPPNARQTALLHPGCSSCASFATTVFAF